MYTYIGDWEIYQSNITEIVRAAFEHGECEPKDVVWRGPSGDAIIASDPAELDEEYAEYTDAGTVDEYLC